MNNRMTLLPGESLKISIELNEDIKKRLIVWIVFQLVKSDERKMIELKYNQIENCYETIVTITDEWEFGEWVIEYVYLSDSYGEPQKIYNSLLYPQQLKTKNFEKESFIVWKKDLDAWLVRTIKGWVYLRSDGTVDKDYKGMAKNHYGWWYVSGGVIDRSFTGMARNHVGWWYMKKGKLDRTYTGIAKNKYGYWYMQKGFLSPTYNGTIVYEGKEYTVIDGKVNMDEA